eukprot:s4088_g1.t1
MPPARVKAEGRQTGRQRSQAPSSAGPARRREGLGSSVPGQKDADGPSGPVKADVAASSGVLAAVQQAAQELSPDDLAALGDASFRSQASRWRSGNGPRKLSAAFARFLNAMGSIKPAWLASLEVGKQGDMP